MEFDLESAQRMSDRSQAIERIRRAREANLPIGPIVAELRQEGWSAEEVEGFVTLVDDMLDARRRVEIERPPVKSQFRRCSHRKAPAAGTAPIERQHAIDDVDCAGVVEADNY